MENLGREKEQWLRGFLELPNGIPDKNTFQRVFTWIDPQNRSSFRHLMFKALMNDDYRTFLLFRKLNKFALEKQSPPLTCVY
jgi:hypothetical protein